MEELTMERKTPPLVHTRHTRRKTQNQSNIFKTCESYNIKTIGISIKYLTSSRNRAQRAATTRSYPVQSIQYHQFRHNRVIFYSTERAPTGRYEDSWEPFYNLSCRRLILEYWERRAFIECQNEMNSLGIDHTIYTGW